MVWSVYKRVADRRQPPSEWRFSRAPFSKSRFGRVEYLLRRSREHPAGLGSYALALVSGYDGRRKLYSAQWSAGQ